MFSMSSMASPDRPSPPPGPRSCPRRSTQSACRGPVSRAVQRRNLDRLHRRKPGLRPATRSRADRRSPAARAAIAGRVRPGQQQAARSDETPAPAPCRSAELRTLVSAAASGSPPARIISRVARSQILPRASAAVIAVQHTRLQRADARVVRLEDRQRARQRHMMRHQQRDQRLRLRRLGSHLRSVGLPVVARAHDPAACPDRAACSRRSHAPGCRCPAPPPPDTSPSTDARSP